MKALFFLLPLFSSVLALPQDKKGDDCEADCPLVNCVTDDAVVGDFKFLRIFPWTADNRFLGTMRVHQQSGTPLQRDLPDLQAELLSMQKCSFVCIQPKRSISDARVSWHMLEPQSQT